MNGQTELRKNGMSTSDSSHDLAVQSGPHARSRFGEWPEISPAEALTQLQQTGKLSRVRVARLKLEGEFDRPLEFSEVDLDKPDIRKATFREPVTFAKCQLQGLAFSRGPVIFEKSLTFKSCAFRRTRFDCIKVLGTLHLDRSEFANTTRFNRCELGGIHCWETRFAAWAQFDDCTFAAGAQADFRSLQSDEGMIFKDCQFRGDVLFRGAVFAKKLDLGESQVNGLLDLSKAKLHDYCYLEGIVPGPQQQFAFLNTVAERILVHPRQVQGRLQSEETGHFDQAMQEYGLLKANFQTLHRFDEEDWALYRFKVNQRRAKPRNWWRPWTRLAQLSDWVLLDLGCGYGTKPSRAVGTALLMMVCFAAIYAAGIHHFDIEKPPIADMPTDHLANRVLFGLLTTVSVFTSGFGGDQLHAAHGWMLVPLAIEALLGTLLWGLFIVAFSRKVIR